MITLHAGIALAVFATAATLTLPSASAAVPDYRLGDIVQEDVITPVPLVVLNPEATEALRQKVAQEIHPIVLHTIDVTSEAETALRDSIAAARANFMSAIQRTLNGRSPSGRDLDTPRYNRAVREVARTSPRNLPIDVLAPLWVEGLSDESVVENLVRPVRDVMAQPIVATKTNISFPPYQPVRVVPVKSASEPPAIQELETAGRTVSPNKVVGLWRARLLVEAHFAADDKATGKFAASFVRTNARLDPALTELLRAKRMEGLAVNDTYDAAQMVARKGQMVDRKLLSALAVLREKSLIGALQNKLELEQSVAGKTKQQAKWVAAGLGFVCLVLVLVVWRLRSRPGMALVPIGMNSALAGPDATGEPVGPMGGTWQNRALLAEARAERAQAAIRSGVLGWMREKIFQTLFRHRAELLSSQQKAELEMRELEQRLEQLHAPLQERISAYEARIAELEKELAAKGEENRELIGARITVARQQLMLERERGGFGTN